MMKTKFIDESNKNAFKTILIMAAMTGFITLLGYLLAISTGNSNIMFWTLVIAIGQNVIAYFLGPVIAIKTSGAVLADINKYSELHRIVEELSERNGLVKPEVYVINDPAPNAFATGTSRSNAKVAATTGLLAMLDRGELEGVMAHELTHIKNRDMLVMTIVVAMSAALSTVSNMALYASTSKDNNNNSAVHLVVAILSNILMPFVMLFIQSAISRKREFMADAGGALLTEHPEALASALQKIGSFKQPLRHANAATAHLYISSPFGGSHIETWMQRMFATHPPIEERVKALIG